MYKIKSQLEELKERNEALKRNMSFASFKQNMDSKVIQSVNFDDVIRKNIVKSQIPKN